MICLGVDLFGLTCVRPFVLPGPECLFFHPQVWEVFSSIASSNFSDPSLSLSPSFWDVYDVNVHMLDVVQKSLIIILFKCCLLLKFFFLFRL